MKSRIAHSDYHLDRKPTTNNASEEQVTTANYDMKRTFAIMGAGLLGIAAGAADEVEVWRRSANKFGAW